jgi:predicted dienelactone hydrolase
MIRLSLAFAAALCLIAPLTHAAGLKFIQVPGGADGPPIDAAMWSPCSTPATEMKIGALSVPGVPNCAVSGEKLPLIIISHGYGGWYLGHHDTAEALADAGFVVVAINHPHANYADMSRANGLGVLVERPVDIKRTIDFMLTASPDATKIDPQLIGFYGFSQGGYTGLVLAGADPDFNLLPPRCADPSAIACPSQNQAQPPRPKLPPQFLTHDPRIKAMVLADPLSVVFQTSDSLRNVRIPLQLWGSELGGGGGASPENVATVARLLPDKPDFRIVSKAVHLSFLTPCPKTLLSLEVCVDAPGFDRAAFHKEFDAQVAVFFRKYLAEAKQL